LFFYVLEKNEKAKTCNGGCNYSNCNGKNVIGILPAQSIYRKIHFSAKLKNMSWSKQKEIFLTILFFDGLGKRFG
jgi:hypothetical protein